MRRKLGRQILVKGENAHKREKILWGGEEEGEERKI